MNSDYLYTNSTQLYANPLDRELNLILQERLLCCRKIFDHSNLSFTIESDDISNSSSKRNTLNRSLRQLFTTSNQSPKYWLNEYRYTKVSEFITQMSNFTSLFKRIMGTNETKYTHISLKSLKDGNIVPMKLQTQKKANLKPDTVNQTQVSNQKIITVSQYDNLAHPSYSSSKQIILAVSDSMCPNYISETYCKSHQSWKLIPIDSNSTNHKPENMFTYLNMYSSAKCNDISLLNNESQKLNKKTQLGVKRSLQKLFG